eukprot:11185749-Lingulodinium_polyedra.AAC.1
MVAMVRARESNVIPWNMGTSVIPGRFQPPGDGQGCSSSLWISAGFATQDMPRTNLFTRSSDFESWRSL